MRGEGGEQISLAEGCLGQQQGAEGRSREPGEEAEGEPGRRRQDLSQGWGEDTTEKCE